jgi:Secretion system C-terminal sorting domain
MRKSPLLFLSLSFLLFHSAYAQDILWEKSLGGKQADYLMDAQPTADYGFILAGSSLSSKTGNKTDANKGDLDYWIWKLNENGDLDWQKSFGGSGSDLLQSIALTSDGGFVLGGVSSSNKGFDKKDDVYGQDDFWIIKLNAFGAEEWQATLGGISQEKLHSIKQTRDGGFILGGSSSSGKTKTSLVEQPTRGGFKTTTSFGNIDYWVVKLDRNGKIEWQKSFGGSYVDELRSIDTTRDGGYILGGYSNSPATGNKTSDNKGIGDYWVIKLDPKGEIQWQKTIGGDKDDQLSVIRQTYDNGFVMGGNSNSESSESKSKGNGDGTDFWVVKLDEKGDMLWQETYNYGKYDILTSIVENDDHTLLLGGFAKGEINATKLGRAKAKKGTDDYIALKINEKGAEIWSESVGSDGEDILKKVIQTRDGGFVFAGTSNPQSFPSSYAKQNTKGVLSGVSYSNEKNQAVQDTKNDINQEITNTTNEANQKVKDNATAATNGVKEGLGMDKDSPLKLGTNDGASPLSLGKIGDGKGGNNPLSGLGNGSPLPRSGDKKKSFGNNDFWVVKLRDKTKPEKVKATIEAFPNPSTEFTNVIVGYDFETGTATVADLSGRVLQTFEISSRTVPIDLSTYPEGIYVVNIKTNVQSDGVKVIKKINKK